MRACSEFGLAIDASYPEAPEALSGDALVSELNRVDPVQEHLPDSVSSLYVLLKFWVFLD